MTQTMLLINRADTMEVEQEELLLSDLSYEQGLAEIRTFFPHPSTGWDDGTSPETLDSSPFTIFTPSSGDTPSECSNHLGTPKSIFRHFRHSTPDQQDASPTERRVLPLSRPAEHMAPTSSGPEEGSPPLLPMEQMTAASSAIGGLGAGPSSGDQYAMLFPPASIHHESGLGFAMPTYVPWVNEGEQSPAPVGREATTLSPSQMYQSMLPPVSHDRTHLVPSDSMNPALMARPYDGSLLGLESQYLHDMSAYTMPQYQGSLLGMAYPQGQPYQPVTQPPWTPEEPHVPIRDVPLRKRSTNLAVARANVQPAPVAGPSQNLRNPPREPARQIQPRPWHSDSGSSYRPNTVSNSLDSSPIGRSRSRSPQPDIKPKGGRLKGGHLADENRERAKRLRHVHACWRCAFRRDPCDEGLICRHCQIASQRGQAVLLPCDRRHMRDLIPEFLPESMTKHHELGEIAALVDRNIAHWYGDESAGINVQLTCGIGPLLSWKVHEFAPRDGAMAEQLQYLSGPNGARVAVHKPSPLLAIRVLDKEDSKQIEAYVNLIISRYLFAFSRVCFEDEKEEFQMSLLVLLSTFYMSLREENKVQQEIKSVLYSILQLIVLTFISGHTLTITDIRAVVTQMRPHPGQSARNPYANHAISDISPRIANEQLKFLVAIVRNSLLENTLQRLQTLLRTASDKTKTWLPSFLLILGVTMVLEESQIMLQMRADARVKRGQANRMDEARAAVRECEKVDDTSNFLKTLFHVKYRKRGRATASWDDCAAEMMARAPGSAEMGFIRELGDLVGNNHQYLRARAALNISPQNAHKYTSRLVGKLLLEFMGVP